MITKSAPIAGRIWTRAKAAIAAMKKGGFQTMTEEAREARRQYYRDYYQAHKEQRKETTRRYWERKAEIQRQKTPETAEREPHNV